MADAPKSRDRVSVMEPVTCGRIRTVSEQAGDRYPGDTLTRIVKDWFESGRPLPLPEPAPSPE